MEGKNRNYYIINGITLYRLLAAPVLVVLCVAGSESWFRWLLALSFFTDLIDGFLARKFRVASIFGSRLDSVADDLTIAAAMVGLFVFRYLFIKANAIIFIVLFGLYALQIALAFKRYGKTTSFHTYLAKGAAILQGCFLILVFFVEQPLYLLFYAAAFITFLDLLEEIILVLWLREWKADVKGLYWVLRKNRPAE